MASAGGSGANLVPDTNPPAGRKVFCVKFQREMEGLDEVPFDGHPLAARSTTTCPSRPGRCGSSI
jgi:hypothetical protein